MRKMRLDRLLSRSGVSRRDAAALVKAGRVTVNGQTARGLIDRESTVIPTDEGTYDVRSPAQSPLGTMRTGWVTVLEDATLVRRDADPEAEMTGRVNAGAEYACYAEKTGTTDSPWYYIYIYDQNAWGWIAGQRVSVKE